MLDKYRKRARSEQNSIRQIYRAELNNLVTETKNIENVAKTIPKYGNIKNGLYKIRKEEIPKFPKNKSEISLTYDRFNLTSYCQEFVLIDTNDSDRIIAFASKVQIEILSKSARWNIDVNKTNDIYQKTFTNLEMTCKQMGYNLQPKTIMSDFEIAVIKAVRNVFPTCATQGCYFYYIQCIWKNIKEKGLTTDYKKNEDTRKSFDKIKSLAFLPQNLVIFEFIDYAKLVETEVCLNYYGKIMVNKRRPEYIIRDQRLFSKIKYSEKFKTTVYLAFTPCPMQNVIHECLTLIGNLYRFEDIFGNAKVLKSIVTNNKQTNTVKSRNIEPNNSYELDKQLVAQDGQDSVIHWDKKENIFNFNYDSIMIPININNNHWILCHVDNNKCKVTIYDSFLKDYPNLIDNLRQFLNLKYKQVYNLNLTEILSINWIGQYAYDCDFFGNDLVVQVAANFEACWMNCLKNQQCNHYFFRFSDRICIQKSKKEITYENATKYIGAICGILNRTMQCLEIRDYSPESRSCSLYYRCVDGIYNLVGCSDNQLFDPYTKQCSSYSQCHYGCRNSSDKVGIVSEINQYYDCQNNLIRYCKVGESFDLEKKICSRKIQECIFEYKRSETFLNILLTEKRVIDLQLCFNWCISMFNCKIVHYKDNICKIFGESEQNFQALNYNDVYFFRNLSIN
ncbi:unnamed protein product [Brachionus calyciflorus]|uniref:Chitin-binding type-2 domain-containing protein n=1 Tax=Brachionus calyciflorus TaxID=104777 RepID=A0A813RUR5_9BILA|nr:unnamed protein product [Brachionus calyciflorus]